MRQYISDIVTGKEFIHGQFNIIASGTGTGKTEFVRRTLVEKMGGVDPSEILYVTSRSMIRDQQSKLDGIERFENRDVGVVRYWNGENDELKRMHDLGIWIMNYNQLAHILDYMSPYYGEPLNRIKIAVFDECHALVGDKFIESMGIIRQWIRERMCDNKVLLIGLTATNAILNYYAPMFSNRVECVNDKYIVNYKAKHLICGRRRDLFDLLTNGRLEGKTIILCRTVDECREVNRIYPNSVVLISKYNKDFNDDMKILRDYIIEHEVLPEDTSIFTPGHKRGVHPIEALITTTSMREGINLREESGIKNVICCIGDEMHVKQFAGRCRFNIDNLVVLYEYNVADNSTNNNYTAVNRRALGRYIANKDDREWFDTISDIVDCSFDEVERYNLDSDWGAYLKWVDENWLSQADASDEDKKWIGSIDHFDFIDQAFKFRLFDSNKRKYTFNRILGVLCNKHGYKCGQKRFVDKDGAKRTLKYIYKDND